MPLRGLIFVIMVFLLSSFISPEETNSTPTSQTRKSNETVAGQPAISIQYFVKRDNLYIETFIPNFSYNPKSTNYTNGYVTVWIDGKEYMKAHTAAFVVNHIEKGQHEVKLTFFLNGKNHNSVEKTFIVTI